MGGDDRNINHHFSHITSRTNCQKMICTCRKMLHGRLSPLFTSLYQLGTILTRPKSLGSLFRFRTFTGKFFQSNKCFENSENIFCVLKSNSSAAHRTNNNTYSAKIKNRSNVSILLFLAVILIKF